MIKSGMAQTGFSAVKLVFLAGQRRALCRDPRQICTNICTSPKANPGLTTQKHTKLQIEALAKSNYAVFSDDHFRGDARAAVQSTRIAFSCCFRRR